MGGGARAASLISCGGSNLSSAPLSCCCCLTAAASNWSLPCSCCCLSSFYHCCVYSSCHAAVSCVVCHCSVASSCIIFSSCCCCWNSWYCCRQLCCCCAISCWASADSWSVSRTTPPAAPLSSIISRLPPPAPCCPTHAPGCARLGGYQTELLVTKPRLLPLRPAPPRDGSGGGVVERESVGGTASVQILLTQCERQEATAQRCDRGTGCRGLGGRGSRGDPWRASAGGKCWWTSPRWTRGRGSVWPLAPPRRLTDSGLTSCWGPSPSVRSKVSII